MKLKNKMFVVLVTGLLLVYLGSCLVQRHFAQAVVSRFSQHSKAGELERHWQWVGCVQQAITTSLEDVTASGDMDMFSKILHEQASLPGLLEASLTDFKGHVAYTTVPTRLHGDLPAELKSQLLGRAEMVKREADGAFEIYKPLPAEKNCLTCHTERHAGEVLGVLSLRFSDQALKTAEQSWSQFDGEFSRENAVATAATTVGLIVILASMVGLCVRFFMSQPLEQAADEIAGQSDQVRLAALMQLLNGRQAASATECDAHANGTMTNATAIPTGNRPTVSARNGKGKEPTSAATAQNRRNEIPMVAGFKRF